MGERRVGIDYQQQCTMPIAVANVNTFLNLKPIAQELLGQIGCAEVVSLHPVSGGANNHVVRVDCGEHKFILKSYYHDANDSRDRFATELAFTQFAWDQNLRCLPQPLASDKVSRAILFSFADGSPMAPADVDTSSINQAMDFAVALNAHRAEAKHLPTASEYCSSLAEHIQLVDERITRLRQFADNEVARDFVETELTPVWERLRREAVVRAGSELGRSLLTEERCLSPCDFGFHNALLDDGGQIMFVDYEYAGWDDPARTVCDFFCQVAVAVPEKHLELVLCRLSEMLPSSLGLRERVAVLMPIYQVKWCCIVLNEFLPRDRARREFARADNGLTPGERGQQLLRAQAALSTLTSSLATAGTA
jgi:hypothetical protein